MQRGAYTPGSFWKQRQKRKPDNNRKHQSLTSLQDWYEQAKSVAAPRSSSRRQILSTSINFTSFFLSSKHSLSELHHYFAPSKKLPDQNSSLFYSLLPTLCVFLFSFAFFLNVWFLLLVKFLLLISNPPTLLAFVSISCPWRQPWYFYISPLKQEMFKILCNGRSFEITMCHFSVRLYKRYANNFLSLKTSTFPIILWKFCIMRDNIYILIQKSGEYFFGLAFIFRPRFGAVISCI